MKTKATRSNGDGTLYRHGKNYMAKWMAGGKTFYRSTGTSDRREAEKRLAEFVYPFQAEDDIKRAEAVAVRLQGRRAELQQWKDAQPATPLKDGFEEYADSKERPDTGERTMDGYRQQYARFTRWIEANYPDCKEMRQVSKEIADRFATDLARELSANSYNKYLTLFTRIWKVLAETARLTCNPWEKMRHKTEAQHTRRELTVEELIKVCSYVSGEMRVLFAIGLYTGLRLGDCALLDWGEVDMVRSCIMLIPRKTARHANGKRTVISIHKALYTILAEVHQSNSSGYVLPTIAQQYKANPSTLCHKIQRVFNECGLKTHAKANNQSRAAVEVGFHSLRHTFVSMAANAGTPLAILQAVVGHSNPAMTRHYYHADNDALKRAVDALPQVLPSTANAPQPSQDAPQSISTPTLTSTPPPPQNAPSANLRTIYAMLAKLTPSERQTLAAHLATLN